MVLIDLHRKLTDLSFIEVRLRLFEYAIHSSLEELLQKTLDEIEHLTGSSIGFYHFVDKDQKSLILQAWSTRTEKEFCRAEGKGKHYEIDRAGVWVDCVSQKSPVIHNDYSSLAHRRGMPEGHAEVIRELVVPVIRNDSIVAILGVGNKSTDYTKEDVKIVSYLADVAWEIVERKRMEEALKKANDDLEKKIIERTAELEWKNRELEEFAFVASHDLQAPLRKIKMFGEMVREEINGALTDKGRDYLRRITKAADRMQDFINSLLAYSRSSSKTAEFERVALQPMVEKTASDLLPAHLDQKPVIDIEDLPEIEADPVQMTQLFQNLLSNALHYQKKDSIPNVKIFSRRMDSPKGNGQNYCEVLVQDNGIGFEMRYADRIFLPFERLHGGGEYEGNGIGLAICKKIVENHGGKITAESTPGKGTTFIIKLPYASQ